MRPGDPPLNELLHHLHPRIELIQGKDVLLSKQPQSRALPEVLQREGRRSSQDTWQRWPGAWEAVGPARPGAARAKGNGKTPAISSFYIFHFKELVQPPSCFDGRLWRLGNILTWEGFLALVASQPSGMVPTHPCGRHQRATQMSSKKASGQPGASLLHGHKGSCRCPARSPTTLGEAANSSAAA